MTRKKKKRNIRLKKAHKGISKVVTKKTNKSAQIARQEKIKRRKNFFPLLLLIIVFWILAALVVYFVDPNSFSATSLFFAVLFVALLFTFSAVFENTRRGLITSSSLVLFLYLRFLGIGNIINFLLIAGVMVSIELYFYKNHS